MTDARLPGRWLTDVRFDQLTDRAHRTFTNSLMFSAEQGTDGAIATTSLRFLHPLGVDAETRAELIACGLWLDAEKGVQVAKWEESQSTAASIADRRRQKREWQAKDRASKKATSDQKPWTSTETTTETSSGLGKAPSPISTSLEVNEERGPRPLDVHVDVHALGDGCAEPSLFCAAHPNGSGGIRCGGCGDARRMHEQWVRMHPKPTREQQYEMMIRRIEAEEAAKQAAREAREQNQAQCIDCGAYPINVNTHECEATA